MEPRSKCVAHRFGVKMRTALLLHTCDTMTTTAESICKTNNNNNQDISGNTSRYTLCVSPSPRPRPLSPAPGGRSSWLAKLFVLAGDRRIPRIDQVPPSLAQLLCELNILYEKKRETFAISIFFFPLFSLCDFCFDRIFRPT